MNQLKKTTILFLYLFIIGFIPGCSNATENQTFQNLNYKEFFEMILNEQALILDVRTSDEFIAGHIKNSVLIPVQILNTDYTKIINYKNNPILIYCRSGNRSVTASNILSGKGFKKLYNLEKGINDWVKNGFTIEK